MNMNSPENDYLSTVGKLDPAKVLEIFGIRPVVAIVAIVCPRLSHVGHLEQRGQWVRSLWKSVMNDFSAMEGCRLNWSMVLFATESQDLDELTNGFARILKGLNHPDLASHCILCPLEGKFKDKWYLYGQIAKDLSVNQYSEERFKSMPFPNKIRNGHLV